MERGCSLAARLGARADHLDGGGRGRSLAEVLEHAFLHGGAVAGLGVWALEMGVLLGLAYLYDEPRRRVRVRPALSGVVEG